MAGIFTQPGSFSDLGARSCEVRFTSMNGHRQADPAGPKSANTGSGNASVSKASRGRAALGSCATVRSLRVLGGAIRICQLLLVLRRQLRWLDGDGQLVDLARERERDLIIAIIYRRSGSRAYVEGLIDWKNQRHRALHFLRRSHIAVHSQGSAAATADAAHVVEGKRSEAETFVLEVEHDGVLAGRKCLRAFPADAGETQQVPGEDGLALQKVHPIPAEPPTFGDNGAVAASLR